MESPPAKSLGKEMTASLNKGIINTSHFHFGIKLYCFRTDMRETKIDNHHSIECHSVETSTMIERTDINSNNNDVNVLILIYGGWFIQKSFLVYCRDEYRK